MRPVVVWLIAGFALASLGCGGDDDEPLPGAGFVEGCGRELPADLGWSEVEVFAAVEDIPQSMPGGFAVSFGLIESAFLPEVERAGDAFTDLTEIEGLVAAHDIDACKALSSADFTEATPELTREWEAIAAQEAPETLEEVRATFLEKIGAFEPDHAECIVDRLLAEPGAEEEILAGTYVESEAALQAAYEACEVPEDPPISPTYRQELIDEKIAEFVTGDGLWTEEEVVCVADRVLAEWDGDAVRAYRDEHGLSEDQMQEVLAAMGKDPARTYRDGSQLSDAQWLDLMGMAVDCGFG